jgi:hypothetical protein
MLAYLIVHSCAARQVVQLPSCECRQDEFIQTHIHISHCMHIQVHDVEWKHEKAYLLVYSSAAGQVAETVDLFRAAG